MHEQDLVTAGLIVTLAFFALTAFVVWALRSFPRLPTAIIAIATLIGALPAVIYALGQLFT